MAKAALAGKRQRSWLWLQGVLCGGAAAMLPGTAFTVVVLLAPGLAMLASEQRPGRVRARGMILMGSAASFMTLRSLWEAGGSFDAALNLLGDPGRVLLAWGASGGSWLLGQMTEVATKLVLDARSAGMMRNLHQEKQTLMDEWLTDGSTTPR